jgi:hypothetical protein
VIENIAQSQFSSLESRQAEETSEEIEDQLSTENGTQRRLQRDFRYTGSIISERILQGSQSHDIQLCWYWPQRRSRSNTIGRMTLFLVAALGQVSELINSTNDDVAGFSIGGYVSQQLALTAPQGSKKACHLGFYNLIWARCCRSECRVHFGCWYTRFSTASISQYLLPSESSWH